METITTWGGSLSTQEYKHDKVHEVCWKWQKLISLCVCGTVHTWQESSVLIPNRQGNSVRVQIVCSRPCDWWMAEPWLILKPFSQSLRFSSHSCPGCTVHTRAMTVWAPLQQCQTNCDDNFMASDSKCPMLLKCHRERKQWDWRKGCLF